jgi:glycosyltransferase involved in cell wall biosynthesis
MKIGIDATAVWDLKHGAPSGVINYTLDIMASLFRVGPEHNYHIYFRNDVLPEHEHFHEAGEIHVVASQNRKTLQQVRLPMSVHKDKIDVMFFPSNSASLLFPCPTVTTIHDLHPFVVPARFDIVHGASIHGRFRSVLNKTYWRQILRWASKRSTRVITPSEATAKDVRRFFGVDPSKIDVIFEGVDLNHFNTDRDGVVPSTLGLPESYILCMGTHGYKNLEGAIRAFKLLGKARTDRTKLVISGNPNVISAEVHQLIDQLELREAIEIVGFYPQDKIKYLYQHAEMLFFPSFYEGFGLPVVEAFACGTPVISSDRGSLPEVGGNVALYVEPEDYPAMAAAITRLLEDRDFRSAKASQSAERAQIFGWDRAGSETLKSLEKAAATR